jgi:type II secretory pathway component GspD/PulD (secretin)
MPTFTKNVIILCVTLLLFISFATPATGQDGTTWLNDSVSVRFQDESMSTVLGKISQQTGIAILYDEKLADQKVTGHYKDIKFSEAINRLFSETNKSIQVFKNEKKIIVKTFGAKQFILASSAESAPSDNPSDDSEKMTIAELEQMHKRQYKEYKERISNDNEVLEGGMTRGEVKAMHKKQYEEYQKRIADDNEVLEGGMTRGEIQAMHKKQYEEYQKRIADDNEVLEGGMTRGEIQAMHKKQLQEIMKFQSDKTRSVEVESTDVNQ